MADNSKGKRKRVGNDNDEALSSCPLCIERYNNSSRKYIECPSCNYKSCLTCCQTYLLGVATDPRCPNPDCTQSAWSHEFLHDNFRQGFLNKDLKEARGRILLQREQSLMPEAQPHAACFRRKKELEEEKADVIKRLKEVKDLAHQLRQQHAILCARTRELGEFRDDPGPEIIVDTTGRIVARMVGGARVSMNGATDIDIAYAAGESIQKKSAHVMGCVKEGCRGFVQQIDHKCGLCNTEVCEKCLVELQQPHECKPDDVKTAQMVHKDTKPCPQCAARIHKISGCNDMFCTNCHVSFNWRTLEVNVRPGHNPHMFEWLQQQRNGDDDAPRQQQRRQERDPCASQQAPNPTRGRILNLIRTKSDPRSKLVATLLRLHNHIQEITMAETTMREARQYKQMGRGLSTFERSGLSEHDAQHHARRAMRDGGDVSAAMNIRDADRRDDDPTGNLDLRIRFLCGEIDEKRLAELLSQREKRLRRIAGWYDVLDVFLVTARDLLWNLEEETLFEPTPIDTSTKRARTVEETSVRRYRPGTTSTGRATSSTAASASMMDQLMPNFCHQVETLVNFCNEGFEKTLKRHGSASAMCPRFELMRKDMTTQDGEQRTVISELRFWETGIKTGVNTFVGDLPRRRGYYS